MAYTLKIDADINALTKTFKRLQRQGETLGSSISKSLTSNLEKSMSSYTLLNQKLKPKLDAGQSLPFLSKKLDSMAVKIKDATHTKLRLDTQEAFKSILDMKYEIAGVVAGFIAGVKKPISVAMDFESSFSNIKKVVDFDSNKELKAFQGKIWELTKSIPLAAKDLTDIVASGGQLGLDKNLLIPFTETVAKMSTAFDLGTKEAGDNIAKLMNNFNIGITEVTKLGDAINYLGNTTAGAPKEIVDTLGRIAGVAKTMRVTELQATALAGAFANMKVPSDQAGTAINKIFTTLGGLASGNVTGSVKQALSAINLSVEDVNEGMKTNPFETIRNVLKSISKLPKSQQIGVLKNFFGEEAAPKIALITSNVETLDKIVNDLANEGNYTGSMQKEFEAVSATTANSLQLMRNAFARVGNAIGTTLLPIISGVSKLIATMANGFGALLESIPPVRYAVVGLGAAFLGFKTYALAAKLSSFALESALHPLKFALLKILPASYVASGGLNLLSAQTYKTALRTLFLTKVLTPLNLGFKVLKITLKSIFISPLVFGFKALGSVFLMLRNPVKLLSVALKVLKFSFLGLLAATGIGLIIAGVSLVIFSAWEPLKSFFGGFWEGFKEGLAPIIPAIDLLWSAIKMPFTLLGTLIDYISTKLGYANDGLEGIAGTGKRVGFIIGKALNTFVVTPINWAIQKISELLDSLQAVYNYTASSWIGKKLGLEANPSISNNIGDKAMESTAGLKTNVANNTTNITNANTINIPTTASPLEVVRVASSYANLM
ncbi:phage tail tape measure protein [Helicobacter sp. 13S00401-1]|uniref:phage tail tape measure protein n=1 Tax=Helicobacter sp. 13S00401-1 TaxID=1905758 RepID=UPI000BA5B1A7|nr:phage tail tape measure protein [Helicobacter sp. 13S00401-1]PAF49309.1 phage tail tape measure protein [Helicobacter sp. 13S00401-1]